MWSHPKLALLNVHRLARSPFTFILTLTGTGTGTRTLENQIALDAVAIMRLGSESNRRLTHYGIKVYHGDIRNAGDIEGLPPADWTIDAAANPSVLAGFDNRSSTRQLLEHNLLGTINLLEYCKRHRAGFVLLSTSRVYSIRPLTMLPVRVDDKRFAPVFSQIDARGLSPAGIAEDFPTAAPVSLYGATKLASERQSSEDILGPLYRLFGETDDPGKQS